jgi:hypothetical protein
MVFLGTEQAGAGLQMACLADPVCNAEHDAQIAGDVEKSRFVVVEVGGKGLATGLPALQEDAQAGVEIGKPFAGALASKL